MDTLRNVLSVHPSLMYGTGLLAYMALVRHFRYKRINALLKKYPDPTIPLRNLEAAREVSSIVGDLDFPFLNVVSLEFALFKTYAIPSISKVLAATKQFATSCLKRADDTALILMEMNEGYSRDLRRTMTEGKVDEKERLNDERRAEIATERLNFIHGHYNIKQEDYLYTLALFVLEPAVFIGRFEWRSLTELEENALLAMWTHHGRAMGIQNIPETLAELKAWTEDYESTHAVFAKSNVAIAQSTVDLLLSLAPSFTHAFGRKIISSLLTPRLRAAFGIAPPPRGLTTIIHALLHSRALFIRYFMFPRRLPLVRSALRANKENKYVPIFNKYKPVYPQGYRVEDLGPEKFVGKCPISFHPSGRTPGAATASSSAEELHVL
ncbi:hypothetical protein BG011_001281 [Mortierella polycephala]|uniref:ER-bound oxygenase mpaB/mpaB'/Rubber oxygenase catalytic domain-containing protein n=1 Tax=Mortierella polycephala TaxID=41804 RepID=A0A9P6U603_9FUNG|nr:hypothetical protein BG011_001281 [Mortierella polycephala]